MPEMYISFRCHMETAVWISSWAEGLRGDRCRSVVHQSTHIVGDCPVVPGVSADIVAGIVDTA